MWANFCYSSFCVSLLNLLHVLIILVIIFLENMVSLSFHFLVLCVRLARSIVSLVHPVNPLPSTFSTSPFTLFFCITSLQVLPCSVCYCVCTLEFCPFKLINCLYVLVLSDRTVLDLLFSYGLLLSSKVYETR